MFERHIFKFYKFNIRLLIRIPSASPGPASSPDWRVKRVPARTKRCRLLRLLQAIGASECEEQEECAGVRPEERKKKERVNPEWRDLLPAGGAVPV